MCAFEKRKGEVLTGACLRVCACLCVRVCSVGSHQARARVRLGRLDQGCVRACARVPGIAEEVARAAVPLLLLRRCAPGGGGNAL